MQSALKPRHRIAYHLQQLSLFVNATVVQETARTMLGKPRPRPGAEALRLVQRRYRELLARDLANVSQGLYPRELLFGMPIRTYARVLPRLLVDAPRIARRMRAKAWRELPEDVDLRRYPPYYRRTFHWQTDGYLSDRSAALYDLGVELLFRGTADVMRRQVIPPITRHLRERTDEESPRLLDIACGTGRVLEQLAVAHPQLRLHGVDLSPYYVRVARQRLATAELSLMVENAESLPYVDGYFDIATCVYLFHELPRNARRQVVKEMLRVIAPGGMLVIEDSAQLSDSPELADILAAFADDFHEPFYRDYLEDDLATMLAEAGFVVESSEPHLVAKVVVARRPPLAQNAS